MRHYFFFCLILSVFIFISCEAPQFPLLEGDYLGQLPPGDEPEVFAAGIISTGMYNRDLTVSPDGKSIYYGLVIGQNKVFTIMETHQTNTRWSEPVVSSFASDFDVMNLEPHIAPDGKRFFFMSDRPDSVNGRYEKNEDIWVMDKTEDGWSDPYNLGEPVNTMAAEFFPSTTLDGTLYFTRRELNCRYEFIYRSRQVNGQYTEPEKLGFHVNAAPTQFNACIAPDESYLVVPAWGREDTKGGVDYYVSFRNEDDTWKGPFNLGDKINTPGSSEYSPSITPDGNYLFFMSTRLNQRKLPESPVQLRDLMRFHNEAENGSPDIYWVSTSVIEKLRPN